MINTTISSTVSGGKSRELFSLGKLFLFLSLDFVVHRAARFINLGHEGIPVRVAEQALGVELIEDSDGVVPVRKGLAGVVVEPLGGVGTTVDRVRPSF